MGEGTMILADRASRGTRADVGKTRRGVFPKPTRGPRGSRRPREGEAQGEYDRRGMLPAGRFFPETYVPGVER